ncbi:MAG: response regulator, partial [Alphaproteobacteria bacterium]|nr:response regulator [Alphaproteobacteria bacterium]
MTTASTILNKIKPHSIRQKMHVALLIITALTALLGAIAWRAFDVSNYAIQQTTQEHIPALSLSAQINTNIINLNARLPLLLFVRNTDELNTLYIDLISDLSKSRTLLESNREVRFSDTEPYHDKIESLNHDIGVKLRSFKMLMYDTLIISDEQEQRGKEIQRKYNAFMNILVPLIDDALFSLITDVEQPYNKLPHTPKELKIRIETLGALRDIKSDANLLIGILETATNYQDISALPTLEERYNAIVESLDLHEAYLANANLNDQGQLHTALAALIAFGHGDGNVFTEQTVRLHNMTHLQTMAKETEGTSQQLADILEIISDKITATANETEKKTERQLVLSRWAILLSLIASIIAAILIAHFYVRRKITDRIEQLQNIMLHLSENNFSDTIQRTGNDEISTMARTLFVFREKMIENRMLTQHLNDAILEIEEAKVQAESSNHAKSEFLANMSHELRTPLNSILGMTRLLIESGIDGERYTLADTVYRASTNLLTIVNDILDLSKIEAKEMTLENIGFDPRYVLDSVVDTLDQIAKEKKLTIKRPYTKSTLPYVMGDPTRFGRILTNLIGNAIKYTDRGWVQVDMQCSLADDNRTTLRLEVTDTGIGIPDNQKDNIFKKFVQGDTSTTRKYGGTGLGLAITKQLVELMQGDIGFTSEFGHGSVFWISIPFIVTDTLHQEKITRRKRSMSGTIPHDTARILIAEDHPLNQMLIERLMHKFGIYNFKIAASGLEVLAAQQAEPWDVILMDCHMPDINGYDATLKIREQEKETGRHVPIIAMTA